MQPESPARILYQSRMHPVVFLSPALFTAAGLLVLLGAGAARSSQYTLLGGVLFTWGAVDLVLTAWSYTGVRYTLTSERLTQTSGLILRREVETPLSSVRQVQVFHSALGRALGYGNLAVMKAGDRSERFANVRDATRLAGLILDRIDPARS